MLIMMRQSENHTLHKNATARFFSLDNESNTASDRTSLVEVLSELRDLLEDYSPAWYTEEHQRKLDSALHSTNL